jgi:hypothetical protein
MQLPGMSTQPVRVSIEVTWWPSSGEWSIARRGWRRDERDQWQLEEMATSGSPLNATEVQDRLALALDVLCTEIRDADDPFSTLGSFH